MSTVQHFVIIELDLDLVTSATTATNADGAPNYNTPATAGSFVPWTLGIKTYRFCSAGIGYISRLDAIPCLVTDPPRSKTIIEIDKGLGAQPQARLFLQDFLDNDRGEDPFFNDRSPAPPSAYYFRRLRKRQPFIAGRNARIIYAQIRDGIHDPAYDETHHFQIRSWDGIDKNYTASITLVSPLQALRAEKPKYPPTTDLRLTAAVDALTTTFLVEGTQPTPDYLAIDEEAVALDSQVPGQLTVTRDRLGTAGAAHSIGASLQEFKSWRLAAPWEIVRDLLVDGYSIDPAKLDLVGWQALHDQWLALYQLDWDLGKPELIDALTREICESVGIFIWPDTQAGLIRMGVLRPQAAPITITEDSIIADSFAIGEDDATRINRADIWTALRTPLLNKKEEHNYAIKVRGKEDGIGPGFFTVPVVKTVIARPLGVNTVLARRLSSQLVAQYARGRQRYLWSMLAVDAPAIGQIIRLASRDIVDEVGVPLTAPQLVMIISRHPVQQGMVVDLIGEVYDYQLGFAQWQATSEPAFASATADQREVGSYWTAENGLNPDGSGGVTWADG